MTSRQAQKDAAKLTEVEQIRIYSVNKLVDKFKQKFPGMTNLKVFINFNNIRKSKINLYYVRPLGVMINNKLILIDEIIEWLDDGFLFNIKESQYDYMSMRKGYTFWCLYVDCSKQIAFKSFNYYNSKLLAITDQKIINKLVPPPEEFNDIYYFDNLEDINEDYAEELNDNAIMAASD